jgi:hypothetical protein
MGIPLLCVTALDVGSRVLVEVRHQVHVSKNKFATCFDTAEKLLVISTRAWKMISWQWNHAVFTALKSHERPNKKGNGRMSTKLMSPFAMLLLCFCGSALAAPPQGLNSAAAQELVDAGVTQYVGAFTPVASEAVGDWIKHTYDTESGNGPICIAGTPLTVFTKAQNPANVMIFLQGGGACWQDFYFCNILADAMPPDMGMATSGIWVPEFDTGSQVIKNPIADWSVVYLSYCDGSVFSGDNDVVDANFPFGPVRFHRGLRNVTAGIDLAKALFPNANRILVAGSSAGGIGASSNAAFLARMAYGNNKQLLVFSDSGPLFSNLNIVPHVLARANDWAFGQFYPASCVMCDDLGQGTELLKWRFENDSTVREAFYLTDGDAVLRFFFFIPTQAQFRDLTLTESDPINADNPDRYKRFIRSGSASHTALQSPDLYLATANGVPLYKWLDDFLVPRPFWVDIVEDFVPLP